jgi:hypothetical protein
MVAGAAAVLAALAPAPSWAVGMTLDGPFCQTTAFDSTHVTMSCNALAQNGTAPYSYSWARSKGVAISPLTAPIVTAVCTRNTLYRLVVSARDANGVVRENDAGWRTCVPIVD